MTILAALLSVAFLIIVHELGHLLVARALGIGVKVFSIGFGRRLWGVRWWGTDWRISLLPLGGYVRLAGADPMDAEAVCPQEDLMRRPPWQRAAVYAGGPVANLLLAAGLFAGVYAHSGAGAMASISAGISHVGVVAQAMAVLLGALITGSAGMAESLGGPVEIVRQTALAAERGLVDQVWLMGSLSVSLGLLNLLPVPVLDGGRILFFSLEALRGRPVSLRLQERAQQIGVLAMVALMLAVCVIDVHRLIA